MIPAYNRVALLERAVRSVLDQSGVSFELVVVDDGSDEDLAFIGELADCFLRTSRRGPGAARNVGVAVCSGHWVAFLDSDDLWLPGKLSAQVECLARGFRVCQVEEVWYRDGRRVNPGRRHRMTEGDLFERSLEEVCVSSSSVMLERSLFEELGGFDERLFVCEDYDLYLRMSLVTPVGLVREKLAVKHGGHPDQLSRSVPGLDRYRLFSMVKLLAEGLVAGDRRRAVAEAVGRKICLLASGARRHGRREAAALYREVEALLETERFGDALDRLQPELRPDAIARTGGFPARN